MSTKHGRHGQGATLWKSLTICRVSRLASRTTFPLSLVLRDGILRYYQAFWMTDHQSHDDDVISQTVIVEFFTAVLCTFLSCFMLYWSDIFKLVNIFRRSVRQQRFFLNMVCKQYCCGLCLKSSRSIWLCHKLS